ncbi:hypothetical protein [Rothia sp. P5766]|uniref:hypothetical protein n=1 Tax=Rothia sp. P5766 TaxID=3402656 RepID=UPI003AE0DBAC
MGLFSRKKNQPAPSPASPRDVLASDAETSKESAGSASLPPAETAVAAGVSAEANAGKGFKATVEKMRSKADGQVTLSLTQAGNEMSYTLYQRGQEIESGVIEPGSEWFSPVADLYVEEEKSERGAWTRALIVVNPAVGNETAVQVSFMNTEASRTHNLNYSLNLGHIAAPAVVAAAAQTEEAPETTENPEPVEERLHRVSARLASDEEETAQSGAGLDADLAEADAEEVGTVDSVTRSDEVSTASALGEPLDSLSLSETVEESSELATEQADSVSETSYVAQRFAHTDEDENAAGTQEPGEESLSVAGTLDPELGFSDEVADSSAHIAPQAIEEAPRVEEPTVESSHEPVEAENKAEEGGAVHSESASQYPATGGHFDSTVNVDDSQAASQPAEKAEAPSYLLGQATSPEPVSDVPALLVAEDDSESIVADPYASEDLPSHIDDSEFGTDEEPAPSTRASASVIPAAPSKVAAATLDAPMTGASVDVAPSYSEQSQAKPSETQKADGNLILTEAEVVSRLAPAYDALFGLKGTALDVSTVLIRVRTLGSYYDALTHVRRNGFWEQVRTFDLIPEDVLGILQLKADSYKEGYGSPLAINLRFTPGIPVVASFDYADEEAFVRYPEHLPAQQYVEELRMFPRTGANIPAHMSEALASWNF